MKITRARLVPGLGTAVTELVDVTIAAGVIASVCAHDGANDGDLDADGAVVLPGLWDAHTHFSTHALVGQCLDLTQTTSVDDVIAAVTAGHGRDMTLGFGFRAATWTYPPTAAQLDCITASPIALISGDLHAVWCNTAGLVAAGAPANSTGYLVEQDAFDATQNLMRTQEQLVDRAVKEAIRDASARGVVGIVDVEMGWALGGWTRRAAAGPLGLRVSAATYPEDLDALLERGWRSGDRLTPELSVGPLKIFADGSMSTKTAYCIDPYLTPLPHLPHGKAAHSDAELVSLLDRATRGGIDVAVHAIGDMAVRRSLDAFEATAAKGSIEHAQLVADVDIPRFGSLGVVASVQPAHLLDDAAVIPDVWPGVGDRVFPWRSLLDAGARLRCGSDAPVSPLDPWLAMSAAVHRSHEPGQAMVPLEALRASTDQTVDVGQRADLILVDRDADELLAGEFLDTTVLATLVRGRLTHQA